VDSQTARVRARSSVIGHQTVQCVGLGYVLVCVCG